MSRSTSSGAKTKYKANIEKFSDEPKVKLVGITCSSMPALMIKLLSVFSTRGMELDKPVTQTLLAK